jgi:SSS family solute:Na+ symporter
MFAELFRALMSLVDSMLNSAATLLTMDFYKRHWVTERASRHYLVVGRIATGVLALVACLWAPVVANMGSVFNYIQMFWGFVSPGIVTVFVFGLFSPRTPPIAANGAMILGIPIYGALLWGLPEVAFLHHMAITFLTLAAFVGAITYYRPMEEARTLPTAEMDLERVPYEKWWGGAIVAATAVLYIIFW